MTCHWGRCASAGTEVGAERVVLVVFIYDKALSLQIDIAWTKLLKVKGFQPSYGLRNLYDA